MVATVGSALASSPDSTNRRMALGVSMLPDTDMDVYRQFRADSGRWPATWSIWSDWGGTNSSFPGVTVSQLHTGTVPLIYWAPVDPADPGSPAWTYNTILGGLHDPYIRQFAQDAKAYGGRVLLRFAHEMDGDWFPWGIGRFDNTKANFILAWRHVHDIFKSVGAGNVRFRLVTDRARHPPQDHLPRRQVRRLPGDHRCQLGCSQMADHDTGAGGEAH